MGLRLTPRNVAVIIISLAVGVLIGGLHPWFAMTRTVTTYHYVESGAEGRLGQLVLLLGDGERGVPDDGISIFRYTESMRIGSATSALKDGRVVMEVKAGNWFIESGSGWQYAHVPAGESVEVECSGLK